ncbi:MAG: bifunctional 5,10-methylenetetrahydrofolate dehydrogenase/5,10-methenyltetrahydrofolate cyclohydrolase [Elusimicrobiota bacterium]|jgi:methylenetetrahydrofolate dehydrogenase (NADP+)/methenyltetrahydrofolate cyclohydrolase|nr:bifunctional 5,10-methylenetetrahydrofolate dehydrogenase/5,10-methenyltetrahydrofolate cyclohydrolase [Elusimicrobiota bacterium]
MRIIDGKRISDEKRKAISKRIESLKTMITVSVYSSVEKVTTESLKSTIKILEDLNLAATFPESLNVAGVVVEALQYAMDDSNTELLKFLNLTIKYVKSCTIIPITTESVYPTVEAPELLGPAIEALEGMKSTIEKLEFLTLANNFAKPQEISAGCEPTSDVDKNLKFLKLADVDKNLKFLKLAIESTKSLKSLVAMKAAIETPKALEALKATVADCLPWVSSGMVDVTTEYLKSTIKVMEALNLAATFPESLHLVSGIMEALIYASSLEDSVPKFLNVAIEYAKFLNVYSSTPVISEMNPAIETLKSIKSALGKLDFLISVTKAARHQETSAGCEPTSFDVDKNLKFLKLAIESTKSLKSLEAMKSAIETPKALEALKAAVIASAKNEAPGLATILVGSDPASQVYVKAKIKACQDCGIKSFHYDLPEASSPDDIISLIKKLNENKEVNAILLQLPLPDNIFELNSYTLRCIKAIDPSKDADGLHPLNAGFLNTGEYRNPYLPLPCTPAGVIELLKESKIEIEGKTAVVVGRSNLVGKPLATLLLKHNATVITAHSKTKNLQSICKSADILVAALGKPKFITKDFIKNGACVIDVGINRTENGLCGDVDFDGVKDMNIDITPVPGGVGPMTITMLLHNTTKAFEYNTVWDKYNLSNAKSF